MEILPENWIKKKKESVGNFRIEIRNSIDGFNSRLKERKAKLK